MKRYLPAEWAPQSAVQFTFPHADSDWADLLDEVTPCFVDCVVAVSRFQHVLVVCDSIERVRPLLQAARQDRLLLAEIPSNDTWARDHGGITVLEDGKPLVLDFMFNGWGLKFPAFRDNLITGRLHARGVFGAVRLERPGLVLEGGGIESDGAGTLMVTAECLLSLNRNPHLSRTALEGQLKYHLGVDRFLWLKNGYLAGDDTDSHIDTLARFCDEKTIAYVRCDDAADEHFPALRAMEQELQAFRQANGERYRLVPLPWPAAIYADDGHRLPATYANFLIINGAVLVPVYGLPQDAEALQVLAGCFPGREIVAINCRALIEQHGSLHCISMQYPLGVVDTSFVQKAS